MNRSWFYVTASWRAILFGGVGLLFAISLLMFRIGSLTNGASPAEIAVSQRIWSYKEIFNNPINMPYNLILTIGQKLHHHNLVNNRRLSALMALAVVVAFYWLLRFWYSLRIATLGTLLFVSSSWLLRTGRYGTTDILQSLVIVPILISVWLMRTRRRFLVLILFSICAALMLYIPGLIWLLILALALRASTIILEVKKLPKWLIATCGLIFTVFLIPLIYGIVREPSIILAVFGLPNHFSILTFVNNFWHVPITIFIRSDLAAHLSIPHLPLLDIFSTAMAVLGIYACVNNLSLDRNRLVICALIIGWVLASLDGPVGLALILPIIYLTITAGLAFMLDDWFRVFPRNPLAGNIGATLMTVAVLLTVFYQVNNYFIAWPNTHTTRSEFSQRF
ncbi:MAG TPA: hypothetical protein VLF39_01070 [Candidatus Saccharimonadales bacterium]|nr:hypothetical protein [Candidatus Saccharimonadales bacterium]